MKRYIVNFNGMFTKEVEALNLAALLIDLQYLIDAGVNVTIVREL